MADGTAPSTQAAPLSALFGNNAPQQGAGVSATDKANAQVLNQQFGQLSGSMDDVAAAITDYIVGGLVKTLTFTHTSSTVTISNATPAVITWTAHGLVAGDLVTFSTTGALPTGISTSTNYYVKSTGLTTDTFQISADAALDGTAINTSSSGSGVQTATHPAWTLRFPGSGGTSGYSLLTDGSGSSQWLGFQQPSGTTPSIRTWNAKAADWVSVKDYGAAGNGIADDSAAITRAMAAVGSGGWVYFPRGTYLCNNLTVSAGVRLIGWGAGLVKNANGPIIASLQDSAQLHNLSLDGNAGAGYTGACILIITGNYQRLLNCNVQNGASYSVDVSASTGGALLIEGGIYQQATATNSAIRFAGNASETNGDRTIIGVAAAGGNLIDLGGSATSLITACQFVTMTFGDSCVKASVNGCRIALSGLGDLTIKGGDHAITGNIIAGGITIAANARRNTIMGNVLTGGSTVTDNSGFDNNYYFGPVVSFTPTWGADSGSNVLGNGTLTGTLEREDHFVSVTIQLVIGSTTTLAAGNWYFSLANPPYDSLAAYTTFGSAYLLDSGVLFYVGTSYVATGTNKIYVIPSASANFVNSVVPFAWGTGDTLSLSIRFPLPATTSA